MRPSVRRSPRRAQALARTIRADWGYVRPEKQTLEARSPHGNLASDEEAAGSNPGHPDHKSAGHKASYDLRFAVRLSRCPILGAKGERTGLLAGRIPASSRLSSCTADTRDSAAR